MQRPTRSFRLALSPAGMDLLIEAHCHTIRATRSLLSWGATLHIAICLLDALDPRDVVTALARAPLRELIGPEAHFLGAPVHLGEVARHIARRVGEEPDVIQAPLLGDLYILALSRAATAPAKRLRAIHATLAGTAPDDVSSRAAPD